MDEYYLSKDEWDTIVELGVGDSKDDKVLKKLSTATKTAFTKRLVARALFHLFDLPVDVAEGIIQWTTLLRSTSLQTSGRCQRNLRLLLYRTLRKRLMYVLISLISSYRCC